MCLEDTTSEQPTLNEQPSSYKKDHQSSLDWTEKRRQEVIGKAWIQCDSRLLAKETRIDNVDRGSIGLLWNSILAAFQDGGQIGNLKFEKNILPAHSEYHIAKVLTLVTHLIEGTEKKGEKISEEDKLAIVLAVLIHDLGVLRKVDSREDAYDQTQLYERHELRAIEITETVVNTLQLSANVNKSKLVSKIKLLIAGTVVDLNMDLGVDPQTKQRREKLDSNNRQILQLIEKRGDAQFFGLDSPQDYLDEIKSKFTEADFAIFAQEETTLKDLVTLMGAADHGAYLLEPCRFGEINGLWRELNKLRFDEEYITHRRLPFGTTISHEYFTSNFPTTQNALYGDLLSTLVPDNPFVENEKTAHTIKKALSQKEILQQSKPSEDPVSRFEGFFSPIQLLELIEHLEIKKGILSPQDIKDGKLVKRLNEVNSRIIEELKKFSDAFSTESFEAGKFNMLATNVLRELYRGYAEEQEELLIKSFDLMTAQAEKELSVDGKVTIHIAPFVYLVDKSDASIHNFFNHLNNAYHALPLKKRNKIKGITLTWREKDMQDNSLDAQENFNALVTHCSVFNLMHELQARTELEYHPLIWGVSIAGKPANQSDHLPHMLVDARKKSVPVLVHYGLEEQETTMRQRIDAILNLDITENDPLISIHIDNHFDWFVKYYLLLDVNDPRRLKMKILIKSADPLGYMLIKGEEAHHWVTEFFKLFPDTKAATNNSSNNGDLGITVHQAAIDRIVSRIRANQGFTLLSGSSASSVWQTQRKRNRSRL